MTSGWLACTLGAESRSAANPFREPGFYSGLRRNLLGPHFLRGTLNQEAAMARKSKQSILKRQRELRKAEKAALKRERREQRVSEAGPAGDQVATKEDLEGYGFEPEPGSTEQ